MRVWRLGLVTLLSADGALGLMSSTRKLELRELTRDTWLHAFRSYRRLAYPSDEVLPLSCKPQGRDKRNPEVSNLFPRSSSAESIFQNLEVNDVMGSYSLTLVDALDSFAVSPARRSATNLTSNRCWETTPDLRRPFERRLRA